MYELGIKPENAVHFLSKVVTVSSEFEHAAAAAENTVKLKDEKRLKLTSDSKWEGGGAENTFSQSLFIIFKKVGWGGELHTPSPSAGSVKLRRKNKNKKKRDNLMWRVTTVPAMKILFWSGLENQLWKTRAEMKNV